MKIFAIAALLTLPLLSGEERSSVAPSAAPGSSVQTSQELVQLPPFSSDEECIAFLDQRQDATIKRVHIVHKKIRLSACAITAILAALVAYWGGGYVLSALYARARYSDDKEADVLVPLIQKELVDAQLDIRNTQCYQAAAYIQGLECRPAITSSHQYSDKNKKLRETFAKYCDADNLPSVQAGYYQYKMPNTDCYLIILKLGKGWRACPTDPVKVIPLNKLKNALGANLYLKKPLSVCSGRKAVLPEEIVDTIIQFCIGTDIPTKQLKDARKEGKEIVPRGKHFLIPIDRLSWALAGVEKSDFNQLERKAMVLWNKDVQAWYATSKVSS
jgi:hypothetical protein